MKVSILTENIAGAKCLAEHGLSYLLEIDDEQILFDTGHTDVFLKNARILGIDIHNKVNKVVLSHGHWDHGNGLKYLKNKQLFTHPNSFVSRFRKADNSPVGLSMSKSQTQKQLVLTESVKPIKLTDNLYFLGEIPRINDFESQTTPFELEDGSDDYIIDDSALVAIQNNILIVITGCSHAGICNICEYAKKVTGVSKIAVVIGGFHLKRQNKQTRQTIEYFKQNKVETLHPSHCTDLPALTLFYQNFTISQLKTGMTLDF